MKHYYERILAEYENPKQTIVEILETVGNVDFDNPASIPHKTMLYIMQWYYALANDSDNFERLAKDNFGCRYCQQKSRVLMRDLVTYIKAHHDPTTA